ncbi:ATP-binding protein [Pelotalea chapellei]|uniref:histidine kinase n=1 Tax=Pelotalea chapellei TaxID=44671 RepID=A0ABS5UC09_9BACT|nr:ATP-binding protein [Pelotalea chapellei]MBT1073021.1 PAS domain S-box protein [Pelotalea chapellei]
MKQTLEKRIILFSLVILTLTILLNTGMDIIVFRRDFAQEMLLRSQSLGIALKGTIEKVLALGLDIRDMSGLSEKCRELAQSDPEVEYCVITNTDGKPLFSNDPFFSSTSFSQSLFVPSKDEPDRKQLSREIQTSKGIYHNTSIPIRSFDTKAVAYINIGFPQSEIDKKVSTIIVRSFIVLCVSFMASFGLVVFFVKRSIVSPISTLLDGLTKISQGDFNIRIPDFPMHELNELGVNINYMSNALEHRDNELRKNYEELETTHTQLHESYIRLEHLSLDLEKSEELYKRMLEDAGDAIFVLDGNRTVIIANKMAEDFLGYPASQIVGQHISSLLLLLKAGNILQLLKTFQTSVSGTYIIDEITITNGNGRSLIGKIHASSITSGETNLLQVIIRDITKERETLLNLEQSTAGLSRLNKMKDSFLGLASHEIKTPLTVIMGYAELLLTDMKGQLNETTVEMVQNIASAATRLDNIVKDMIDVSMIDQKQLELKLEAIDINSVIEASLREMRFFFALRKQKVQTQLYPTIPAIKGDPIRLMQLMSNVIGNAIKFTPDGGTITITTAVIQNTRPPQTSIDSVWSYNECKKSDCYVEIIIHDNGIGIDPEDQTRIFEKFYEAGNIEEHSSGKVAFKSRGAGLGLSIAKGVVEMHGGEIWVVSPGYNPEKFPGSSFYIRFPIQSIAEENVTSSANPSFYTELNLNKNNHN